MDDTTKQALGGAMTAILTALGVSPVVGEVIAALLAIAKIGPEVYALIQQDIDMFMNGQITIEQLQAKFAQTQTTFDQLSARWKTAQ